ncbi:MAG: hypothetical protein N3G76_01030 [Candidatus Micrarchaeota archaeon]|nr:hypothetical protein [Candidatus Micrarchaeota archaeon]
MVAVFSGTVGAVFTYGNTNVRIYADHEGNAHVIEKISIKIDGESSAETYNSNIAITNDIASWKTRTGIDKIRYHVNHNVAPITNLRVIPQPLQKISLINPSYEGVLQIEYDAKGLFEKKQVKARTYELSIVKDGLSFSTNTRGDIVLEETDYLYIILPDDVQVKAVDPLAQNINVLSKNDKEFFWKGKTILQDFRFVYVYEESLRDEVEAYFAKIKDTFYGFISSQDGIYALIMGLLIVATYFVLKAKVGRNE